MADLLSVVHLGLIWDTFGHSTSVTSLANAKWARHLPKGHELDQTWVSDMRSMSQLWPRFHKLVLTWDAASVVRAMRCPKAKENNEVDHVYTVRAKEHCRHELSLGQTSLLCGMIFIQ